MANSLSRLYGEVANGLTSWRAALGYSRTAQIDFGRLEDELVRAETVHCCEDDANDPTQRRVVTAIGRLSDEERLLLGLWREKTHREVASLLRISDEQALERIAGLLQTLADDVFSGADALSDLNSMQVQDTNSPFHATQPEPSGDEP